MSRGPTPPMPRWPRDADRPKCFGSAAQACDAPSGRGRRRGGSSMTANGGSPCAPWPGVSDLADGPGETRGHVLSSSCRQLCAFGVLLVYDVGWQSPPRPSSHRAWRTVRTLVSNWDPSFPVLCQIFPIAGAWPTKQWRGQRTATPATTRGETRRQLTGGSRCPRRLDEQAGRQ